MVEPPAFAQPAVRRVDKRKGGPRAAPSHIGQDAQSIRATEIFTTFSYLS
jgi:hypothetical protein